MLPQNTAFLRVGEESLLLKTPPPRVVRVFPLKVTLVRVGSELPRTASPPPRSAIFPLKVALITVEKELVIELIKA